MKSRQCYDETHGEECTEPCGWSGAQCDITPDDCWIDDKTGEHVNAHTGERTAEHKSNEA